MREHTRQVNGRLLFTTMDACLWIITLRRPYAKANLRHLQAIQAEDYHAIKRHALGLERLAEMIDDELAHECGEVKAYSFKRQTEGSEACELEAMARIVMAYHRAKVGTDKRKIAIEAKQRFGRSIAEIHDHLKRRFYIAG